MKCFYCNTTVRWNNDFDTEDTHPDSDHEMVSMYECDKCKAWIEMTTGNDSRIRRKKIRQTCQRPWKESNKKSQYAGKRIAYKKILEDLQASIKDHAQFQQSKFRLELLNSKKMQ